MAESMPAGRHGAGAVVRAYILVHRDQAERDRVLGLVGAFELSKPTLSDTPTPTRTHL